MGPLEQKPVLPPNSSCQQPVTRSIFSLGSAYKCTAPPRAPESLPPCSRQGPKSGSREKATLSRKTIQLRGN